MWHAARPDEIVVATHPEHRSNWLARNLVERTRLRCGRPVLHIVADGTNRLFVGVDDGRRDSSFELEVAPAEALDAFHHPFAYASLLGAEHRLAA